MKILIDGIIFQKDPYGGIARLFREILPRMCDLEPELDIILFSDGPLMSETPTHPQIQHRHTLPVRRLFRVSGFIRKIIYPIRRIFSFLWNKARNIWLRKERDAIWHSTFYTLPTIWDGPIVVTVHDMIHEKFHEYYNDPLDNVARNNKKKSVNRASSVICVSETTQKDIVKFYNFDIETINVIPNAYNPIFRRLSPLEIKLYSSINPFILYVGNRSHYKNFSGFVKLFSQWDGRLKNNLVVVGNAWNDDEVNYLKDLEIGDKVFLFCQINDNQLCQLYNQAQALIFPSLYEGFGIPILEALACGCPVVASKIPSSIEVGGNCIFFYERLKPNEFFSALDKAIATGHSEEHIKKGLDHARQYSWEHTAKKTLEVYRSLSVMN